MNKQKNALNEIKLRGWDMIIEKLGNITEKIGSGSTPSGGKESYIESGISLIRSMNVYDFQFEKKGLAFIDDDQAKKLDVVTVQEGDILFNITGDSINRTCVVPNEILPARVNQHVSIIRCKKEVSPQYVNYYLINMKPYLMQICGVGGTRNALTKVALEKLPIKILTSQFEIAKVLSDLDAKIELNNNINAELEAMAKLIYDYWFVQFEFPNEAGKPYKSSGGKMVWNGELKRVVPEGWEVKKLSEIANITMGQSPPGESYNEEKIGTIFYQGCTDFGKRFPTIRKYTTQPTRFAQISDILLSVRAPVGSMNIAKEECCIGRGLAALNSKNDCMPYLFGVMSNLKQIFDRRNTDGTTFGAITKDDLFSIKVISPSDELIKEFDKIVGPMFSQQNTNEFQNNELAELRDWLLPMLMNGQVKVETIKTNLNG